MLAALRKVTYGQPDVLLIRTQLVSIFFRIVTTL
jgi:hypothetical protein